MKLSLTVSLTEILRNIKERVQALHDAAFVMKIILITEILSEPFDEGLKNVVFALSEHLKEKNDALVITHKGNNTGGLNVIKADLNRCFASPGLMNIIRSFSPDVILYVPEASYTFNSFVRAKILKLMFTPSKVCIIGAQYRNHSRIGEIVITTLFRPDMLFLLSEMGEKSVFDNKIRIRILPPAVDCEKFSPATKGEKESIRRKFNVSSQDSVVLHVGHIKENRNIECLMEVQRIDSFQVVVVGSTSISIEQDLKNRLKSEGIIVIDEYVSHIAEIYRMSDIYVFPVKINSGAIDMPLSVLEAMACNLPVITTRFGGLTKYFRDEAGFRYFNTKEELIELIQNINSSAFDNSRKVKQFSWDAFSEEILNSCRALI